MARPRSSMLKFLCSSSVSYTTEIRLYSSYKNPTFDPCQSFLRSSYACLNQDYCKQEFKSARILANYYHKVPRFDSSVITRFCKTNSVVPIALLNSCARSRVPFSSPNSIFRSQSFSSYPSGKAHDYGEVSASSGSNSDVENSSDIVIDWTGKAKDAWEGVVHTVTSIGQKTKEFSDELVSYGQQLLDSHSYLKDIIVPVGYTCVATVLAWVVMPRLLKTCHKYSMQSPAALLSRGIFEEPIPYEKSFWGALENPVRYLVTFMVFLQIGNIVAPTSVASHYIAQGWRGAVVLSLIWFLYRWKTNVFSHAITGQSVIQIDKERLLTLDRVSSTGLFVIGLMALAEACGVAVQSILTVGGIGGVATAFAARDILGNVLSGFMVQLSKPFSLGDTIKAGSIEGQVVQIGLTTTMLLNSEKFPVIVPNSLLSSQVIVNKSRGEWRAMMTKIPVNIGDLDKIPQVSVDIKNMLRSNPKVFLGKEAPYCFLSRVESSFAELTIGCNLNVKDMSKDELYSTEQDVLLQSVQVLMKNGASLGSTRQDNTTR